MRLEGLPPPEQGPFERSASIFATMQGEEGLRTPHAPTAGGRPAALRGSGKNPDMSVESPIPALILPGQAIAPRPVA
jgi:hypothetical protein